MSSIQTIKPASQIAAMSKTQVEALKKTV